MSRTNIWGNIDISRASVTQILKQFQENGMIADCFQGKSTGGRKPLYIEFAGKNFIYFAFDWTTKNLYLMNLDGEILYESLQSIKAGMSPEIFADTLKKDINTILRKKHYKIENILGFVLSLPGVINFKEGKLIFSAELGWQNVHITTLFEDLFGEKVYFERTANILALSEMFDHRGLNSISHRQLIILDQGGMGVSTIIHGQIQHGAHYMHGELGHIKLFSQEPCSCGQKGCLEAIVQKLMRENGGEINNEILEYFAIGISTAINICDTDIVLTGSYVDNLSEAQRKFLKDSVLSKITSSDLMEFEINLLKDSKKVAQRGLCEYMFNCCYPVD